MKKHLPKKTENITITLDVFIGYKSILTPNEIFEIETPGTEDVEMLVKLR